MSKIRLSTQAAQDGATTGQAPVWDGSQWTPTTVLTTVYYVERDRTVAAGGETILTLGEVPVTNSPLIWKNAVPLWDGGVDYTISGKVVTLNTALTAGDVITDWYLTTTAATAAATLTAPTSGTTRLRPYDLGTYDVTGIA